LSYNNKPKREEEQAVTAFEPSVVWTAKRRGFRYIYNELAGTVDWLGQFKPNHLSTRIDKYKTNLVRLANAYDDGKVAELLKTKDEEVLMNSFLEASSLNLIYRGLRNFNRSDAALREKIRVLFDGPEHSNHENPATSTNSARNASFELVMAAHFAAAGYDIAFDREADLFINDAPLLFVESKRVFSSSKVRRNVRRAFKQLQHRYAAADPTLQKRGLIAISISKLINPSQKLLTARNSEHLRLVLNKQVERFIKEHERYWAEQDENTVGVIVHFHVPAELTDVHEYFTCREIGLNNTMPMDSSQDRYFTDVGTRFQNAARLLYG
jgi:hypothetical protein